MYKNQLLIFFVLISTFSILSFKSVKPVAKNYNELILGKWKIDSFLLGIPTESKEFTIPGTTGLDLTKTLSSLDLKEVSIYGLRLKLNHKLHFTKEKTILGSKIKFNKKPYRTSTDFNIEEDTLKLFHKGSDSGQGDYYIKKLTLNNLVFEGACHLGGCFGYRGRIYCSKK